MFQYQQENYQVSERAEKEIADHVLKFFKLISRHAQAIMKTEWLTLLSLFRTASNKRLFNFGYFKYNVIKTHEEVLNSISPRFMAFILLVRMYFLYLFVIHFKSIFVSAGCFLYFYFF